MNFPKQNGPGIDADFSQRSVQRNRSTEDFLGDCASLFDFLKDALMNQIVKLRHYGKGGNVALGQSAQQLAGIEGLEINHARTFDQWEKQICHLRQDVEERENAQKRIGGTEIDPVEDGLDFTQEDLEDESCDVFLGMFDQDRAIGSLVLTILGPGEIKMRSGRSAAISSKVI